MRNIRGQDVESLATSLEHNQSKCVGCGRIDAFSYSGVIIKGKQSGSSVVEGVSPIKVSGILESFDKSYPIVVGGEKELQERKFSYLIKVKGRICRDCASDFRTIEFQGKHVSVVQVDSTIIGTTLPVEKVLTVENDGPVVRLSSPTAGAGGHQAPVRASHSDNRQSRRTSGLYGPFKDRKG
jgi:hypothetical protein